MYKLTNFMPLLFLGLCLALFNQSCNKDESVQNFKTELRSGVPEGNGPLDISDWEVRFNLNNPYRNELAAIISTACCRNPNLKIAIKQSVNDFKLNNNYYEDEMFFNVQKDLPNPSLGGRSIAQALIAIVPEKPVSEVLDFLCKNDPGLAILLEGNLNSTVISNDVYINENFDDSSLNNSVFAYECGVRKQMTIDNGENNSKMVFQVRESEAYTPIIPALTDLIETKSFGTICHRNIQVIGSSINGSDTDPNEGGNTEIRGNDCPNEWRTLQNGKENLYRYKTDKDYDNFSGKGEFLEYALFGKELKYKYNDETGKVEITGAVTDYVQKRQDGVLDNFQWRVVNADLFRWNPEDNGYRYKILWYEDDGGKAKPIISKITLVAKIKLPSGVNAEGQAIFDINRLPSWLTNGDDLIGENVIDWCDPENFDYTPNSIDDTVFNVNER